MYTKHKPVTQEKKQIPIFGYFRVLKEYPPKSQIWKSETSPNQGTSLGIPWLGLVSLCQIWDFYGYSLNTQKYPKMESVIFSCDHLLVYHVLLQWIPRKKKIYAITKDKDKNFILAR